MTRDEADQMFVMLEPTGFPVAVMHNPFNAEALVVLVETPTGIRVLESVLQVEWYLRGLNMAKKALG